MSNKFTQLQQVEISEDLSSNAYVIVEDGGKIRRISAKKLGGSKTDGQEVPTYLKVDYDMKDEYMALQKDKIFAMCKENAPLVIYWIEMNSAPEWDNRIYPDIVYSYGVYCTTMDDEGNIIEPKYMFVLKAGPFYTSPRFEITEEEYNEMYSLMNNRLNNSEDGAVYFEINPDEYLENFYGQVISSEYSTHVINAIKNNLPLCKITKSQDVDNGLVDSIGGEMVKEYNFNVKRRRREEYNESTGEYEIVEGSDTYGLEVEGFYEDSVCMELTKDMFDDLCLFIHEKTGFTIIDPDTLVRDENDRYEIVL